MATYRFPLRSNVIPPGLLSPPVPAKIVDWPFTYAQVKQRNGAGGATGVVIELDAAEAKVVPTELVQVTVKLYDVAAIKPVTVIGLEPLLVPVIEPGDEVAVQRITDVPPFEFAVKSTVALVEDTLVAVPIVGAVGVVQVVIEFDAAEGVEVPTKLVQVTVKV